MLKFLPLNPHTPQCSQKRLSIGWQFHLARSMTHSANPPTYVEIHIHWVPKAAHFYFVRSVLRLFPLTACRNGLQVLKWMYQAETRLFCDISGNTASIEKVGYQYLNGFNEQRPGSLQYQWEYCEHPENWVTGTWMDKLGRKPDPLRHRAQHYKHTKCRLPVLRIMTFRYC